MIHLAWRLFTAKLCNGQTIL